MKKRIKIFKTGKYPQGEFSKERVKKIFSNVKDKVLGVFMHSSKTNGKEIQLADFSKIELEEKESEVEVFAEIELNDAGKLMYEKGMFSGVSVEIPDDTLSKIALLPIGIKPAVQGAEFEKENIFYFEFEDLKKEENKKTEEENKKMNFEQLMEFLKSQKLSNEQKTMILKELASEGKQYKEVEEEKPQTQAEMEQKIRTEFQFQDTVKTKAKKFIEDNKAKITPAMKEAGMTEEFMQVVLATEKESFEFAEKKANIADTITKVFEKMPNLLDTSNYSESLLGNSEFSQTGEGSAYMKAYKGGAK